MIGLEWDKICLDQMNFKGDLKESTRSDRRGSDPIGSDNIISQDPKRLIQ